MKKSGLHLSVLALLSVNAFGLAPHQVAVLVNTNRFDSLTVANHFIARRGVPEQNVVALGLPDTVNEPGAFFTPADFHRHIMEPVSKELARRGVDSHILAWVYSTGFPALIKENPHLSLHGITFTRGKVPDRGQSKSGQFVNPLFQGPDRADGPMSSGFSFGRLATRLKQDMPLPSMSLGTHGARGNSVEEILACLDRGVEADSSRPPGKVYFITSEDVRSRCRSWQFEGAVNELKALDIDASISTRWPADSARVLGLMCGIAGVKRSRYPSARPGAMAEHLTSHAANFHAHYHQTKISEWIRGGMTASAGTVAEPYAIWTKFPGARFYSFQGRGCTILESFFQSVRCPLQLFMTGDPLSRPFAPDMEVRLKLEEEGDAFHVTLQPKRIPKDAKVYARFFLDGRPLGDPTAEPRLRLAKKEVGPGTHRLRGVVFTTGPVGHSAHGEETFSLKNELVLSPEKLTLRHPDFLQLGVIQLGSHTPVRAVLYHGARRLAPSVKGPRGSSFKVPSSWLGLGTLTLHARSVLADGRILHSNEITVEVRSDNRPPKFDRVMVENRDDQMMIMLEAADPDDDPVTFEGFAVVADRLPAETLAGTEVKRSRNGVSFMNTEVLQDVLLVEGLESKGLGAITVRLHWEPTKANPRNNVNGLCFNVQDGRNFDFFGVDGASSAWVIGPVRNGKLEPVARRARPIRLDQHFLLTLRAQAEGLMGYINGQQMVHWPGAGFLDGGAGLYREGNDPAFYQALGVAPNGRDSDGGFPYDPFKGFVVADPAFGTSWLMRVSDRRAQVDKMVELK